MTTQKIMPPERNTEAESVGGVVLHAVVRPTDTDRLNWLLNNRAPGPVCWYRDKSGDEWLLNSRESIDKRMNQ